METRARMLCTLLMKHQRVKESEGLSNQTFCGRRRKKVLPAEIGVPHAVMSLRTIGPRSEARVEGQPEGSAKLIAETKVKYFKVGRG